MIDWNRLSRPELTAMHEAATEVVLCQRVLAKTGDNVVSEILRDAGTFFEWHHYPKGDVYDAEYHAQYYYHAHPEGQRVPGEHGHFHVFLRPFGMPEGMKPAPLPDYKPARNRNDELSHLVGISMNGAGQAIRLFTTNRWVTGETWYSAEDVTAMLDRFVIDHARPSWPTNRWITAMMRLFRPQIAALLHQRDRRIAECAAQSRSRNVYEDRDLEVTSELGISVPDQIVALEDAMQGLRRDAAAV